MKGGPPDSRGVDCTELVGNGNAKMNDRRPHTPWGYRTRLTGRLPFFYLPRVISYELQVRERIAYVIDCIIYA